MLAPDKKKIADQGDAAAVDDAITSRRSVRAFLPDPVDEKTIRDILRVASRAPSGTNMQPWKVYVTTGEAKARLAEAILSSGIRAEKVEWDEYKYYPDKFFEPYLSRRRAVGYALYSLLGIGRREVEKMRAQHDRNFVFFDAPVGMIFTIDRRLNKGSWVDHGMFLQSIMIAARARGLHTCPQAAFAPYHRFIRPILDIPEEEIVVCGMALGYEDPSKPENRLRSERAPLEDWATFHR
ncbi:nitroreductase [Chelativorans salis]|uniref:Nitroreductase n=1 Tax=Chelativorans salis TaxID=2978478 RepID=A0ABT2LM82_9HYPH|nr:nitroreductase [Chelativorans sp. EGI FJ00035]MCT7375164.1 nitroreductase [Chelativorans sp. EGI FJ00035]